MIRINLLPHRELKRKQQQQQFLVMLALVVALSTAIWMGGHYYLSDQLEQQNGRNAYLESEVATLDKQIAEIKKLKELTVALLQRKKVVESLQANRAETVYLLDQLVRQLPDGVYLKAIQQKDRQVNITGYAQSNARSNARVSTFMRNLEASPYLEKPSLIEIKAVTERNTRLSEFSLAVLLARTKDEAAGSKPGAKPRAKPAAAAPGAAGTIPSTQVLAPARTVGATPAATAAASSTPTRSGSP
ncbi:MAG: PilN domain-containing protein [Betaproteobacteria bacterium]|nr:PilN domain-containing protein [Betaproteobacteria bacterium]